MCGFSNLDASALIGSLISLRESKNPLKYSVKLEVSVCVCSPKESMTPNKLRTTSLEAAASAYPSSSNTGEKYHSDFPE